MSELEALREEAKSLGIKSTHNMLEATLVGRIEDAKRAAAHGVDGSNAMTSGNAGVPPQGRKPEASIPDIGLVVFKEGDGWLYHKTEKPRTFKDREEVPEGWSLENFKNWRVNDAGDFINVNG